MWFRRHPVAAVAIALSIVPAAIELWRGLAATLDYTGITHHWASPTLSWMDDGVVGEVYFALQQRRWPVLMLLVGFALATGRGKLAVVLAWTYVVCVSVTVLIRWNNIHLPSLAWLTANDLARGLRAASGLLTLLLTQVVDLLIPILLVITARQTVEPVKAAVAMEPAPTSPVAVESRVLTYSNAGTAVKQQWWISRLGFAVACVAATRLACEAVLVAGWNLTGRPEWESSTLPMYGFGPQLWMPLDAGGEFLLRVAWLLILIALWPGRSPVRFPWMLMGGAVAMAGWFVLQTAAVAVGADGEFVAAGHTVAGVVDCVRVGLTELAVPLLLIAALAFTPAATSGMPPASGR